MPITGEKDVVRRDDYCPPGFSVQVVWFVPQREAGSRVSVTTGVALRRELLPYQNHERLVIYLDRDGGNSGSVWVHITGDRAQVSYFTEPGDVGSHCCDPQYDGPDEMVGFLLSNGQLDHYHRYWTVTRADAFRALDYFVEHAERDPTLNWVTDPRSILERPM